jgi:hypothetical protein
VISSSSPSSWARAGMQSTSEATKHRNARTRRARENGAGPRESRDGVTLTPR